ncbi:hypothetical protein [Winogradskyella haliclonae]|nr:hypothetical protein [Winogradskyella haliclonae]
MIGNKSSSLLIVFFILAISCANDSKKNIGHGNFKLIRSDSTFDVLTRDSNSQIRVFNNSNIPKQFYSINWTSWRTYNQIMINPKNKYDSIKFKVEIDSIISDTFYESIYNNKNNLRTIRKLIKFEN